MQAIEPGRPKQCLKTSFFALKRGFLRISRASKTFFTKRKRRNGLISRWSWAYLEAPGSRPAALPLPSRPAALRCLGRCFSRVFRPSVLRTVMECPRPELTSPYWVDSPCCVRRCSQSPRVLHCAWAGRCRRPGHGHWGSRLRRGQQYFLLGGFKGKPNLDTHHFGGPKLRKTRPNVVVY